MSTMRYLLFVGLLACAKENPADSGASPADDTAGFVEEVPAPGEPGADIDNDADGWYRRPAGVSLQDPNWDCSDGNPEAYPGAPELCDGRDNDCNDVIDDVVGGCSP